MLVHIHNKNERQRAQKRGGYEPHKMHETPRGVVTEEETRSLSFAP